MRSLSLEDTTPSEVGYDDLMPNYPSKYLLSIKTIEANYRPLRELDEILSTQITAVMNDASKALINMATRSGVLKVGEKQTVLPIFLTIHLISTLELF